MNVKNNLFVQINNSWGNVWYKNEYSKDGICSGYSFIHDECDDMLKDSSETFIHIINDGNKLYEAMKKSEKGSSWKSSVQRFCFNWMHNLRVLQHELRTYITDKDGRSFLLYHTSKVSSFIKNERGKTRVINGNTIRDRVVRHSLNDNVLNPVLEKYLIYENCASITGKGISKQREILNHHLKSYYNKHHSNNGYILIGDFSKFFDNIQHEVILNDIAEKIGDEYAMTLVKEIFKDFEVDVSYMSDEEYENCLNNKFNSLDYINIDKSLLTGKKIMKKSVNIGDQTSQIIGVYFPTRIDNYIKIVKGLKYYGRYMDDFYAISDSKDELLSILNDVKKISKQLGLFLNEKKTHIYKLQNGFTFLQIKYVLQKNGYIFKRMSKKNIINMKRKLRKLHKKYMSGTRSFEDIYTTYHSWIINYKQLMSSQQYKSINKLFKNLFGNYNILHDQED